MPGSIWVWPTTTLRNPDRVKEIILHLHRFDPKMSQRLIADAECSDLSYLVGT